jgi:hypothetical protein
LPGIETDCEILSALLYRLSSVMKLSFSYQPLSLSTLLHKTYIG